MAQFQLDTSGRISIAGRRAEPRPSEFTAWEHLDAFTQGYIEALFFTEEEDLRSQKRAHELAADGLTPDDDESDESAAAFESLYPVGFSDLAPETLARIISDCDAFKAATVHIQPLMGEDGYPDEAHAGHDFWLTRNGHGAGFWDGDWPEPHASELDAAAKAAGSVDAYLGDDGKVWLS